MHESIEIERVQHEDLVNNQDEMLAMDNQESMSHPKGGERVSKSVYYQLTKRMFKDDHKWQSVQHHLLNR